MKSVGAVTNVTSPEGTISYAYDAVMGWLTNAYTAKTDVRYGYDALGRLQTVSVVKREGATLGTPEVTTNLYTALGSLQDVYYANGVRAVYQYDALNRMTNLTQTNASGLLAKYSYAPNANGWRQSATEVLRQTNGTYATNQWAWGHDNLGRLTNETCSSTLGALNITNRYGYDLAGNRLWRTNYANGLTQITGYTHNANDQLLLETTGASIVTNAYDANGSVTNRSSGAETILNSTRQP